MEEFELALWKLLEETHHKLNWWDILCLVTNALPKLLMKSEAEFYLKGGK